MTAIVGIQLDNCAVIAADSLITYNGRKYEADSMLKIFEKAGYVYAFAGDSQAADIAAYCWTPPKIAYTKDPVSFLVGTVLPSLRAAMIANGYVIDAADKESGWDALFVINGKIFEVDHYFAWSQDDKGYYGIGAGGATALGAVAVLEPTDLESAEAAAIKAIKISSDYNDSVGGKIQLSIQRSRNVH
jgi:ATP-dependent protease HslVU (ClpYQ) peptidase subunit